MPPQGDDQSLPPPTSPSTHPSPPPLWEDAVKGGMKYRLNAGRTYEYRCKSYLGESAVKLGLTISIPHALQGHTMTCFHETREILLSFDTITNMLARSSLKGLTISDFFWAWEDLYSKYSLDIFVKILGTFYGQMWELVRKRLEDGGFKYLPAQFKTPWLRYRSLSDLLAVYPASEGPSTPFIVVHGRVKISIPARSSPSTATTSTTLSITTEEIPDIRYDALSDEESAHLRDYFCHTACTAISHKDNAAGNWDLLGIDSERREFSMSEKELQREAWVGDALLHRLSKEVLTEARPALPLRCIKAVDRTFNSNPVQAAFARRCGWYRNPRHLSKVDADHLGGTFVEGGSCLSFEVNCKDSMASAKLWVKGGVECVARPLVQAFKYYFTPSRISAYGGSLNAFQTMNPNTAISSPSESLMTYFILSILANIWWNLHVPYQPLPFYGLASLPQSSRPRDQNIMARYCWPSMPSSNNLPSASLPLSTVSMPTPRQSVTAIPCSPSSLPSGSTPRLTPPSCLPSPPSSARSPTKTPPPRGVKRVLNEIDTNADHPRAVKLQTKEESDELQGSGSNLLDTRERKRARG